MRLPRRRIRQPRVSKISKLVVLLAILTTPTTTGFVGRAFPAKKAYPCALASKKDSDNNPLISLVDSLAQAATTPTPLLDLPLGYPLALATAAVFLPVVTSGLLVVFFCCFVGLGRSLRNDDLEEDDFPINLVALVASTLSTAVLAPTASYDTLSPVLSLLAVALAGAVIVSATAQESGDDPDIPSSPERQRMDLWDQELDRRDKED